MEDNVMTNAEVTKRIKECEEFFEMTSEEFVKKVEDIYIKRVQDCKPLPHRLVDNLSYWLILLERGDLLNQITGQV
jgi:hypothetical protein